MAKKKKPDTKGEIQSSKEGREVSGEAGASVLQASEVKYRWLFEMAKEGILILDAETVYDYSKKHM